MKIIEVDTYRKQLQKLANLYQNDNDILTSKIKNAQYKVKDLKEIIIAIDGDINAIKYVEQEPKKNRFFIGLAVNANTIKFTGPDHIYYPLGNVWSYLPQINSGLDLFSDKDAKLMFRGEVNLSATQTEFSYTNTLHIGTPGVTTYTYKNNLTMVTISLNPQILYNFYNKTKFKAFIAGGPKVDLIVNQKNKESITYIGISPPDMRFKRDFPISQVYFNFTAKAGITLERFQVYGAYTTPFTKVPIYTSKPDIEHVLYFWNKLFFREITISSLESQ